MGVAQLSLPPKWRLPPIPEMMALKLNCIRKVLPEELFITRSCLYEKQENYLNSLNSPASSTPYCIAPWSSIVVGYCNERQELRRLAALYLCRRFCSGDTNTRPFRCEACPNRCEAASQLYQLAPHQPFREGKCRMCCSGAKRQAVQPAAQLPVVPCLDHMKMSFSF